MALYTSFINNFLHKQNTIFVTKISVKNRFLSQHQRHKNLKYDWASNNVNQIPFLNGDRVMDV